MTPLGSGKSGAKKFDCADYEMLMHRTHPILADLKVTNLTTSYARSQMLEESRIKFLPMFSLQLGCFQWPFSEPKLEVPTIYSDPEIPIDV